jgi:hypothetical protein
VVLKNGVLNGILNKRQEVKRLLRVQHAEKQCNLYVFRLDRLSPLHCSPDIIMILISRGIRWVKITECTKFNRTTLRRKALEGPRHRRKDKR